MNCMRPHIARFLSALVGNPWKKGDLWKGHAWVNLFAEGMRCAGVSERIIKARIGGVYGLPHFFATLAGAAILWSGWRALVYIIERIITWVS